MMTAVIGDDLASKSFASASFCFDGRDGRLTRDIFHQELGCYLTLEKNVHCFSEAVQLKGVSIRISCAVRRVLAPGHPSQQEEIARTSTCLSKPKRVSPYTNVAMKI